MTAWQTCREAELKDVDGYVFHDSSMSPNTSNLEVRNGSYPSPGLRLSDFSGPGPIHHPLLGP